LPQSGAAASPLARTPMIIHLFDNMKSVPDPKAVKYTCTRERAAPYLLTLKSFRRLVSRSSSVMLLCADRWKAI